MELLVWPASCYGSPVVVGHLGYMFTVKQYATAGDHNCPFVIEPNLGVDTLCATLWTAGYLQQLQAASTAEIGHHDHVMTVLNIKRRPALPSVSPHQCFCLSKLLCVSYNM